MCIQLKRNLESMNQKHKIRDINIFDLNIIDKKLVQNNNNSYLFRTYFKAREHTQGYV